MQQSIYDALAKYTGDPAKVEPWLAERWTSSPDAKTWTFHLVKNAKFHNGDSVERRGCIELKERKTKCGPGGGKGQEVPESVQRFWVGARVRLQIRGWRWESGIASTLPPRARGGSCSYYVRLP
ncbi:MAG: ABC transporter substrate-binding protein, partial [Planctomycetota bacterium]|nr:ABC transporter substrate-binding protein [Planctomycetota bacterium]